MSKEPENERVERMEVEVKRLGQEVRHDLSLARAERREDEERAARKLDLALFRRLFSWTRPYAAKRNWLFAAVILRSMQIPALAWAIGAVINGPISRNDGYGVFLGAAGFAALAVWTQVTMHFRQRWALELGEYVVYDLRNAVFRHLMSLPVSYFGRTRLGSILSRITSDMEALRMGAQNVLFVSIVQLGQMLGCGVLMAWYNWRLFLVVLLMAPAIYAINKYFHKRIGRASRVLQESFSRVTATVAESVKGIQVTQGFAREQVNAGLFRQLIADHSGYNMGLARNIAIYLPLLELNSQIFVAVIVVVGGLGVLSPSLPMEVGDLVTFFFLANLFFSPIAAIGRQFSTALTALAGAERVFRMLDTPPDWKDDDNARDCPKLRGRVEFRDVCFHYVPSSPVLNHISFTAEAGQTIALVGHTGSGKSTIINLLSKFYLPVSGEILFDGMDVRTLRTSGLRRNLGMVLQHNFLFSGTVRDNIRLGRPEAGDAAIVEAVRSLDCLDLVEAMPEGLDTVVGEGGSGLSLGQRQIVCFARAMLADPAILILDEATASVDTITEARLQSALERLMRDRTCFVVAHRLSTIRGADRILVLNGGRIAESGTHAELLETDGLYGDLYQQFADSE